MKPTFSIQRPSRHLESQRPKNQYVTKSPATDWHFQHGVELRTAGTSVPGESLARFRGLYAITQGVFEQETKWEDRIEAIGLCVVSLIALWPIAMAVQMAINTVG